MRSFGKIIVMIVLLLASIGVADAAAPRGTCAGTALKAASASARESDKTAKLASFAQVQPTETERGAADAFFEARFQARGAAMLRYRIFMLCDGMIRPSTLAIQQKYD